MTQAVVARTVLLTVIAHHMNAGGYAWPSVATLCQETGYGKRYVLRLLDTLYASGELISQVRQGPGGSNLYRLGGLLATTPEPKADDVVVDRSEMVVYGSEDDRHVVVTGPPEGKAVEGRVGSNKGT